MRYLTLQELDLRNKRVLMRVDFNVPLSGEGAIVDDSRIRAVLPSIEYVLKQGAILILISHLGRPDGKKNLKESLAPCAKRLAELLDKPVQMAPDVIGPAVAQMVAKLQPGEVLLLENVRFYAAEEQPSSDPSFARSLAQLGDVYVNDAFAAAHRAHASIVDLARLFPGKAAAGLLMQTEMNRFQTLLTKPKRPFYAVIGGAKIGTKIGVLSALLSKVDALYLGGGMVFTFLQSQGVQVGRSLVAPEHLETARRLIHEAQTKGVPLVFPSDFVIAKAFQNEAEAKLVTVEQGIDPEWFGMDIGPATVQNWMKELSHAATLFWNGPLGVVEMPSFRKGTRAIAEGLAHLQAHVVVGGGDSVAAIQEMGFAHSFAHLSTGGGAALELLEFGTLPGIDELCR